MDRAKLIGAISQALESGRRLRLTFKPNASHGAAHLAMLYTKEWLTIEMADLDKIFDLVRGGKHLDLANRQITITIPADFNPGTLLGDVEAGLEDTEVV